MSAKIKKGDTVEVIGGRDKGERGEVIKVSYKKNQITVQGVNMRHKHQRQVQQQGRTVNPGIIEFEGPVHASNVMLVCPKCGELTRVLVTRDDGEIQRVCKKCDEDIA
jgi:large subunit ribosomal protein L24